MKQNKKYFGTHEKKHLISDSSLAEVKNEIVRLVEEGTVRYEKRVITIQGQEFETFVLLDSGVVQYKNEDAKRVDKIISSLWKIY